MLPFDNRPWAKPLARLVIGASLVAAGFGSYYLYTMEQLYIPEITGILLLLLTIIPPNVAVLMRRPGDGSSDRDASGIARSAGGPKLHHR